jgi:hypothetical protein
METWFKYVFTIRGHYSELTFNFKLKVKVGENIIEKGYLFIQTNKFNRFKKINKIHNLMDVKKFCEKDEDPTNIPIFIKSKLVMSKNMEEVKNIVSPLETIKIRFSLNNIKEIIGCPGCYNESMGQLSHMGCPEGCLHEKEECSCCNLEEDFEEENVYQNSCKGKEETSNVNSSSFSEEEDVSSKQESKYGLRKRKRVYKK